MSAKKVKRRNSLQLRRNSFFINTCSPRVALPLSIRVCAPMNARTLVSQTQLPVIRFDSFLLVSHAFNPFRRKEQFSIVFFGASRSRLKEYEKFNAPKKNRIEKKEKRKYKKSEESSRSSTRPNRTDKWKESDFIFLLPFFATIFLFSRFSSFHCSLFECSTISCSIHLLVLERMHVTCGFCYFHIRVPVV